jgi:hypothetical protein
MLTMLRLPIRIAGFAATTPTSRWKARVYPDEEASKMAWDWFRTQLSPASSLAADLTFREDWQRRQLWNSNRPMPRRLAMQGEVPWTPGEFWLTQAANIPLQELIRESNKQGFGPTPLLNTLFLIGTGARVSPDYSVAQEHAAQ